MNKSYIKKASYYGVAGSIGVLISSVISGCEQKNEAEASNMFIVLQERAGGGYDVVEKHPTSGLSRAIVRDLQGNERMMSNEELTLLAQQEAQRVDNGSSNMGSGGGMSMGEAILAAATGAILGNLIGNALANKMNNNSRFQSAQRQSANKTASSTRGSSAKKSSATKSRSGFFGKSTKSRRSSSRGFFGG